MPLLQHISLKTQWRQAAKQLKMDFKIDTALSADGLEFEQYRTSVGLLFGKNVNEWKSLGNDAFFSIKHGHY